MGQVVRLQSARTPADSLEEARAAFFACCRSKNLSPKTQDYYSYRLVSFEKYLTEAHGGLSPEDVTPAVVRDYLTHERETRSASTANHSLCALRVFFHFLRDEGYIHSDPTTSIPKLKQTKGVVQTFGGDEIAAVLSSCGKDFCGVRDRAVILTLLDCGLRASELCGLELEDVDWSEQTFRVIGKGDKERIVPFGQGVRQALTIYIGRRGDLDTSAVFVTQYGEPLNRYRLREIVRRRCEQSGISGLRCSPHTLRHTCAVSYLRSGGDTFTLQKLLGHASHEMTRRYCESLSAEDVQAKHREFSPVDNMKNIKPKDGRRRLR